ncbi:hypothetical protein [Psychrobacter sp. 72-O-c]|uniref:hypothetical protein n=1 Tax=Psychrobacter sp. 72-O-c TaxID=2774125 RepID=UPI001D1104DD|nr:hypothetical protein [Psychrobacter sp. 72-O-c]
MTSTTNTLTTVTVTHASVHKKWLCATLATVALSLSACADKAPEIGEPDAMETIDDAQTPVEQAAIGVDDVEQVAEGVNSADISDDSLVADPTVSDDVVIASGDDGVVVEGVDDSEILDGSEQVEHVSTY